VGTPKHSLYGASKFHRILACHGSVRMSQGKSDNSHYTAELGTAAHELAEWCLKTGINAYECLGLVFNKFTVDLKMAEGVQLYVSFIRDLCRKHKIDPLLEVRVIMSSVSNNVYGTADCILIVGDHLFIIDYKNGFVVVEAHNNPQAIFYGIAALDTFNLWGTIKKVTLGIVQPNGDHIDGTIRTAELNMSDMGKWQQKFSITVNSAKSKNAPCNAGIWCSHCPASGSCRTRIMRTLNLVYGDKPIDEMNSDELAVIYAEASTMRNNIEKIEDKVLGYAREGKKVEGYKLVRSIQRAKCNDEKGFVAAAIKEGVKKETLFNTKLISMTDCKRLLPHTMVNKWFTKPPTSTSLVKENSSRAAVSTSSAVGKFKPITPIGNK